MDAHQADLLRSIDPHELGHRIRAVRAAKGMTQSELAGADISTGYVSRIESGQRRPNGTVLCELAARLDTPVDLLLTGVAPLELEEIQLTLDFAELSLESGQPLEAEAQSRKALDRARAASLHDMVERARYLHARAVEAQGLLDDAILEFEALSADTESLLLRAQVGIALSRSYRESGDFNKAIDAGEGTLALLAGDGLGSSDEAVQLAVTLAAAYYERGDVGQAVRLCRTAVAEADELGSPRARASAYWNSSILLAERGAIGEALPLAQRALALLGEGQDARNLARLRTKLGDMLLRLDPPEVEAARLTLEQAAEQLAWSSAGPVDVARNDLALARAHFLGGDAEGARILSAQVFAAVREQVPMVAADAKALEGQAAAAQGDIDDAVAAYNTAVLLLTGIGADRTAAQLWFELADLLEEIGHVDAARDAYRRAAASVGLRSRSAVRATV